MTPSLHAELSLHQLEAARFGLASLLLRRILVDSPHDTDALEHLGLILAREGRILPALEALSASIALAPPTPTRLYNLAAAHCAAGDWPAALQTLDRCLALDPTFPPALALRPPPAGKQAWVTIPLKIPKPS